MKKYNVAVIGYGWASTAHIEAINTSSLAQVTALYSSRPQDGAALSARHGGSIQPYTDLAALLARTDIHAVSICSYPHQHPDHIIAAARSPRPGVLPVGLEAADEEIQRLLGIAG